MDGDKIEDQKVDVNFESHPPIEQDLDGIASLLRQSLLNFIDCNALAKYLIGLKDLTQVIALETSTDEEASEDEEPDDNIYGIISVINLSFDGTHNHEDQAEVRKELIKFLKDKCPESRQLFDSSDGELKIGMIVNERYINLPPQLSVPTLKNLTKHIEDSRYSHLIFVSKILLKSRSVDAKLSSKKAKTGHARSQNENTEPLVFVNPEEEIIWESSESSAEFDVSSFCDENATWSFKSDVKYTPHRRIMIIDRKKWPTIMKNLEKELGSSEESSHSQLS